LNTQTGGLGVYSKTAAEKSDADALRKKLVADLQGTMNEA
jgi:hypothetical protein